MYEGEIVSQVSTIELPEENYQSNFSTGNKYVFTDDGCMWIFHNDKLFKCSLLRFKANGKWLLISELSNESVEWILEFCKLSAEEKQALTDFPAKLIIHFSEKREKWMIE